MFRRAFLRRAAAAAAALFGGAPTLAAPPRGLPGPVPPRRQRVDFRLFRINDGGCEAVDWFDQRAGDLVCGVRPDGRVEIWVAAGEPYWSPAPGGWVEAVKIAFVDRRYPSLAEAGLFPGQAEAIKEQL